MVAPSKHNTIRYYVVEVPVEPYAGRLHETKRRREMLPWADPYIAGLVQRLKHEIEAERAERLRQPLRDLSSPMSSEATPPLHSGSLDYEQPDRDSWPMPDEIY